MLKSLFLLTILCLFTCHVTAQEKNSLEPVELPPGVLPLPEPGSGSVVGTVISAENAAFYKEILVPELFRLIRFNSASVDAAKRVKYEIKFDENWEKGTNDLKSYDKKLTPEGGIDFSFPKVRGSLFGDFNTLQADWDLINKADQASASALREALGSKILWNISSSIWSQSLIDYHFRLMWLKDGKAGRNVRGNFLRIYPWMLDPNFKLPQMFREKFGFYYPEPLHGLSWLTFRFQNLDEDIVWAYSPTIQKVRQLTGSNRTDSLITSSFSADDFLGWSGNPLFEKGKVLEKIVTLVPFPNPDIVTLDSTLKPCYKLNNPSGGLASGDGMASAIWNFETPKFVNGADWLPIKAVFVPRVVYKLDVTTKDPYSLYGRQTLYVDAVTMLPVYKVVFDRAGRLWKFVITSFGIAQTQDLSRRSLYPGFEIILDILNKREFVMDFAKIRYCDSYPQDIEINQFDPKKIIP